MQKNRILAAVTVIAAIAVGCLWLRWIFIPTPGNSVTLLGFLDDSGETWSRPDTRCSELEDGNFFFMFFILENTQNATRFVDVFATWAPGDDGVLHAYRGVFDPENPLDGCYLGGVGRITAAAPAGSALFDLEMDPGERLFIVASTRDPGETLGEFELQVSTQSEDD